MQNISFCEWLEWLIDATNVGENSFRLQKCVVSIRSTFPSTSTPSYTSAGIDLSLVIAVLDSDFPPPSPPPLLPPLPPPPPLLSPRRLLPDLIRQTLR